MALDCTQLYCTVHDIGLYSVILYGTQYYCMLHGIGLYSVILYNTWYQTVLSNNVRSIVLDCTQ